MIKTSNRKTFEAFKKAYASSSVIDILGRNFIVKNIHLEEYNYALIGRAICKVKDSFEATIELEEVVML